MASPCVLAMRILEILKRKAPRRDIMNIVSAPRISVILPAYNAARFMQQAVESILRQTFPDFEFIIINDGSQDRTGEVVRSFSDSRIRLIERPNRGLIASLNEGISLARGEYLARMDADDISLPERFQKQIAFLESHPEHGLVGTGIHLIDEDGKRLIPVSYPESHEEILLALGVYAPLAHPTIMARTALMRQKPYGGRFKSIEDFELWTHLILQGKFANLPQTLLEYRFHSGNFTKTKSWQMQRQTRAVATRHLFRCLPQVLVILSRLFQSDPASLPFYIPELLANLSTLADPRVPAVITRGQSLLSWWQKSLFLIHKTPFLRRFWLELTRNPQLQRLRYLCQARTE